MYGWPTGSHQLVTILWSFSFITHRFCFFNTITVQMAILATGYNAQNLPLITKSVLNQFTPAGLQWRGLNESECSQSEAQIYWLYEPSLHHVSNPGLPSPHRACLGGYGMAKIANSMLYVFSTSSFNRIFSRHPMKEPSWLSTRPFCYMRTALLPFGQGTPPSINISLWRALLLQ